MSAHITVIPDLIRDPYNNISKACGLPLLDSRFRGNDRKGFTLILRSERAFTLIELLVVISIIAILSVIGITVFSGVQNNARVAATKSTLKQLRDAMIMYRINNGELPPVGDSCPSCYANRAERMETEPLAALASSTGGGPYIANPKDFIYDAWGQALYYDDNDAGIPSGCPCQTYPFPGTPPTGCNTTGISGLSSSGPDKTPYTGDDIIFNIVCP